MSASSLSNCDVLRLFFLMSTHFLQGNLHLDKLPSKLTLSNSNVTTPGERVTAMHAGYLVTVGVRVSACENTGVVEFWKLSGTRHVFC